MDLNCTTDKYDLLYAPWLENPGKLLDAAGWQPGQVILDLCGGTGAVARECVARGADPSTVHLFDLNPRCGDDRIVVYKGNAEHLGEVFGPKQPDCLGMFDVIVIRQAAAYLTWSTFMLSWLRALLKPGGKLVFNIFTSAPRLRFRAHKFKGAWFLEAGCRLFGKVYHLQASPGIGADVSCFYQHNLTTMKARLYHWFDMHITAKGRSQVWVCTRRAT
jgi:SAM-dependent methyltransferase